MEVFSFKGLQEVVQQTPFAKQSNFPPQYCRATEPSLLLITLLFSEGPPSSNQFTVSEGQGVTPSTEISGDCWGGCCHVSSPG